MTARVVGVHRSAVGGVPKPPVDAIEVTVDGVVGDHQQDAKHHGGPDRAVCVYAQECIDALVAEGHPIARGTTGENVTVAGLEWARVQVGDRLSLGAVVLEITDHAVPCATIAGSFHGGRFARILHTLHPGWSRLYARVLVPGRVRADAPVLHLPALV